ncbi:hypothetical protein ACFV1Q_11625, partial [Streptomyces sp. NPDC059604]
AGGGARPPPTTFWGLAAAPQPVPPGVGGPYTLSAGERAYAAVRTADPATSEGRVIDSLSVAADPSHLGVTFSGATVGMPGGVHVWEPITTLWQESSAAADRALADAVG